MSYDDTRVAATSAVASAQVATGDPFEEVQPRADRRTLTLGVGLPAAPRREYRFSATGKPVLTSWRRPALQPDREGL